MSDKLNLLGTLATNFKGKGSVAFVNCGYVYFFYSCIGSYFNLQLQHKARLYKGWEKDEPTSNACIAFMSYRWSFEVDDHRDYK